MRIRHIEVFHAVYTCRSVTRAARLLNVSQPSVSKVLSLAELQLGFKLFDRGGGRLIPTREAEHLFSHVSRLFDEIGVVKRVAENLRDVGEGKIRLAATPTLGIALVPELVATFLTAHKGVHLELETLHFDEIVSALAESRIDLALAFDPPAHSQLTSKPLATGEFVFVKPHNMDIDARAPVDLAQLEPDLPFVRLNNRGPLGQLLDNYLLQEDASFNVVATTETYHIAHALVARGVGVSIIDAITASTLHTPSVEVLALRVPLHFDVCAVELDQAPQSKIRASFVSHAESVMRTMLQNP